MKQIDWVSYVKLFCGLILIFPLVHAYWSLDFGVNKGFLIATLFHLFGFLLGVIMLNYLENGDIFKPLKKLEN